MLLRWIRLNCGLLAAAQLIFASLDFPKAGHSAAAAGHRRTPARRRLRAASALPPSAATRADGASAQKRILDRPPICVAAPLRWTIYTAQRCKPVVSSALVTQGCLLASFMRIVLSSIEEVSSEPLPAAVQPTFDRTDWFADREPRRRRRTSVRQTSAGKLRESAGSSSIEIARSLGRSRPWIRARTSGAGRLIVARVVRRRRAKRSRATAAAISRRSTFLATA